MPRFGPQIHHDGEELTPCAKCGGSDYNKPIEVNGEIKLMCFECRNVVRTSMNVKRKRMEKLAKKTA